MFSQKRYTCIYFIGCVCWNWIIGSVHRCPSSSCPTVCVSRAALCVSGPTVCVSRPTVCVSRAALCVSGLSWFTSGSVMAEQHIWWLVHCFVSGNQNENGRPFKGCCRQSFWPCFITHCSLYTLAKRCFPKEVTEKSKILFWLSFPDFAVSIWYHAWSEKQNVDCVSFLIWIFVF